jgi:hypothetical protein
MHSILLGVVSDIVPGIQVHGIPARVIHTPQGQLPDDAANGVVTDANYLSSLRFDVSMPATSLGATPVAQTDLTFAQVSALVLNDLAADEESTVTLAIRLLSQTESGAAFPDNDLSGKGAFLQATFDGESI